MAKMRFKLTYKYSTVFYQAHKGYIAWISKSGQLLCGRDLSPLSNLYNNMANNNIQSMHLINRSRQVVLVLFVSLVLL